MLGTLLCVMGVQVSAGEIHLNYTRARGSISIKTWKDFRDAGIVKQSLDTSCGAAATATILKYFYGVDVSERMVLHEIAKAGLTEAATSFVKLKHVVEKFGFRAFGAALDFEQLKFLKAPIIANLRPRGQDRFNHFSVVRGISKDGLVLLGDPSWGNQKFEERRFRPMWEVGGGRGNVLMILPKDLKTAQIQHKFFVVPKPTTRLAVQRLTLPTRTLPNVDP